MLIDEYIGWGYLGQDGLWQPSEKLTAMLQRHLLEGLLDGPAAATVRLILSHPTTKALVRETSRWVHSCTGTTGILPPPPHPRVRKCRALARMDQPVKVLTSQQQSRIPDGHSPS